MKKFNKTLVFGMLVASAAMSCHAYQYQSVEELERDVRDFCYSSQQVLNRLNQQQQFRNQVRSAVRQFSNRFDGDMYKFASGRFTSSDERQFTCDAQCMRLLSQLSASADLDDRVTAREIIRDMVECADAAYCRVTGTAFSPYSCPQHNLSALVVWKYCSGIHRIASRF